jgi:hypothetical protein
VPDQEPVQPEAVTTRFVTGNHTHRPAELPGRLLALLLDQRQ